MSRHRGRQTLRLIRLMALLERKSVRPTVPTLAREIGVCERTIKRYLATLTEAHYPMPPSVDQVEW